MTVHSTLDDMNAIRFGDFLLEERLDGGGELAFFRATRAAAGSPTKREPCVVLRASREAANNRWPPWADPSLARVLSHRTIVRMLDDGEIDLQRYFAFEYVDGVDLRHLLRAAPLPRSVALAVTRSVVEALCAASAAVGLDGTSFEFLHGALTPRWVLVSSRGEVKLGGFGLGYVKPERPRGLDEDVLSTPEQLLGGQGETPQTDIFQVGLLLHRMAFASEFVSDSLARILEAVRGQPVAATPLPGADPPLDALLRRLLAERPEDRFRSILHVREAIDALVSRADAESEARAWLTNRVGERRGRSDAEGA